MGQSKGLLLAARGKEVPVGLEGLGTLLQTSCL